MARVVFGFDELIKTLERLQRGREVPALIRSALREAGRPVQRRARQLAPEDEGSLSRSIKLRAGPRSRRFISVVVRPGTRSELGIPASASGYYPAHVELGTEHIEEDPYLRDAMDEQRDSAIHILSDRIGHGLVRLALK